MTRWTVSGGIIRWSYWPPLIFLLVVFESFGDAIPLNKLSVQVVEEVGGFRVRGEVSLYYQGYNDVEVEKVTRRILRDHLNDPSICDESISVPTVDYGSGVHHFSMEFCSFQGFSRLGEKYFQKEYGFGSDNSDSAVEFINKTLDVLYFYDSKVGRSIKVLPGGTFSKTDNKQITVNVSNLASKQELTKLYMNHISSAKQGEIPEDLLHLFAIENFQESRLEQARAIYNWVRDEVKYGSEIFGYKPLGIQNIEVTANRKVGVCNDQAALLSAIYDKFQFSNSLVLVDTEKFKLDEKKIPDNGVFNPIDHVVVYLEEYGVLLDPTSSREFAYQSYPFIGAYNILADSGKEGFGVLALTRGEYKNVVDMEAEIRTENDQIFFSSNLNIQGYFLELVEPMYQHFKDKDYLTGEVGLDEGGSVELKYWRPQADVDSTSAQVAMNFSPQAAVVQPFKFEWFSPILFLSTKDLDFFKYETMCSLPMEATHSYRLGPGIVVKGIDGKKKIEVGGNILSIDFIDGAQKSLRINLSIRRNEVCTPKLQKDLMEFVNLSYKAIMDLSFARAN